MRNITTILFFGLLLAGTIPALADQYWVGWDGADFPENEGWTRHWGNWSGPYQGLGANRTLENGILTYDSLYDPGVYDYVGIDRPGQIDPGPGELFVMEWRLKVNEVTGWWRDPGVAVFADTRWAVGFEFGVDHVTSSFEDFATVPIVAGVFHTYQLLSWDMLTYDLYIDGELARVGSFWDSLMQSHVGWGDDVQGAASLHEWDYFRFGVVPEPQSFTLLVGAVIACCGCRRR